MDSWLGKWIQKLTIRAMVLYNTGFLTDSTIYTTPWGKKTRRVVSYASPWDSILSKTDDRAKGTRVRRVGSPRGVRHHTREDFPHARVFYLLYSYLLDKQETTRKLKRISIPQKRAAMQSAIPDADWGACASCGKPVTR